MPEPLSQEPSQSPAAPLEDSVELFPAEGSQLASYGISCAEKSRPEVLDKILPRSFNNLPERAFVSICQPLPNNSHPKPMLRNGMYLLPNQKVGHIQDYLLIYPH